MGLNSESTQEIFGTILKQSKDTLHFLLCAKDQIERGDRRMGGGQVKKGLKERGLLGSARTLFCPQRMKSVVSFRESGEHSQCHF